MEWDAVTRGVQPCLMWGNYALRILDDGCTI